MSGALPKVSVCIASYNHAPFLAATLDSVMQQTYSNVEAVVVDDGSRDSSFDILQEYQLRFPDRIRVFTHPNRQNRGISATFNLATEMSTGEYWSCLGSDDILLKPKIEMQMQLLGKREDVGWVYSYANYIDDSGRRLKGRFGADINREKEPLHQLLTGNCIPAMTVLARMECVKDVGAHTEGLVYSDWEFWIRLLSRYNVAFLPKALVDYRVHSTNTSLGVTPIENKRRGLAVLESVAADTRVSGQLTRPRTKALIHLQRCFHFFCIERNAARAAISEAVAADATVLTDLDFVRWWLIRVGRDYAFRTIGRDFLDWFLQQVDSSTSQQLQRILPELNVRLEYARRNYPAARSAALAFFARNPFELLGDPSLARIFALNLLPRTILRHFHVWKEQNAQLKS